MKATDSQKEIATLVLAVVIFSIAASFTNIKIFYSCLASFSIILGTNIATKKILGNHFEINIKTKFWEFHRYGLKKKSHLKRPLPMAWLPLAIAPLSRGVFMWLGILEFDATPKPERASRRHGLYRFTEVTEKHIGLIAFMGVVMNLLLGVAGYIAGFELFTKLSFGFAMWSIVPISRLDGTKIFFGNRVLWGIITAITFLLFFLTFAI